MWTSGLSYQEPGLKYPLSEQFSLTVFLIDCYNEKQHKQERISILCQTQMRIKSAAPG